MNVKSLAAVVGTLSLASLVTGCKTSSANAAPPAAAATTTEKGEGHSCAAGSCSGHKQEADAAATPEKGAEHACSAGGCGAKK